MDTKLEKSNWRKFKISLLAILLTFSLISANAQEEFQQLNDTLPLGNSFRHGQLQNGFTYFIKNISEPQSKLYLRLYNKVGSSQEDNDQYNVSHAVEHLAFKATQNFPLGIGNSKRIDSLEMDMYDYISAFNGMEGTIYHFNAPQHNIEALKTGLLYFKDIATGLKLKETDIKSVRGEVWQELIMGEGNDLNKFSANSLLYSKIFPCNEDWFNFINNNGNFSSEAVKRFYKDWYRPEMMGIGIVGNIDNMDEMEKKLKETFSDFKSPNNYRKKINCDSAYFSRPNQFVLVQREKDTSKFLEDSITNIHLIYRNPSTNVSNKKQSYEELIKFQFLVDIVAKRMYQTTNKYNSFDAQVLDLSKVEGRPQVLAVILNVRHEQEKKGLKETVEVLNQLQKFGISNQEWSSFKEKQTGYLAQNNSENPDYWLDKILKYYIQDETLSFEKNEYLQNLLQNISLKEVNNFIGDFLIKAPEDIGIIIPPYQGPFSWDEKEIRSFIADEFKKPTQAYNFPKKTISIISDNTIEKLKELGYKNKKNKDLGAIDVVLKNGVRVILKPLNSASSGTTPKIKINGYSLKGANSYPKTSYFSAINAAEIVRNSGLNGSDKYELISFLESTSLQSGVGYVTPYVKSDESGIEGLAGAKDIETMLQLIYLYFTKPNKNKLAFEDWKINEYNAYINPAYSLITSDFENKIGEITGNPWGKGSTLGTKRFKSVAKTDFDLSYNIYQEIFGKADDFTFLISGDFDVEKMLTMVRKYLGNLPSKAKKKKKAFNPQEAKLLPKGPSYYQFPSQGNYKMGNISYGTRFIQKIKKPAEWREQLKVEALGELLRQKLWTLRFKKGYAVYDVKAAGIYNKYLNRYEIISYLDCKPDEFSRIKKELEQIYSELKSGSFSNDDLIKSLSRMYSIYNIDKSMDPKIINQRLYEHYRYGQNWIEPADLENFVKTISVADIVEVANKYCREENFNEFVMWDKKIE